MDFLVFLIRYIFIYLYLTKDNETKKRKDDEDDEWMNQIRYLWLASDFQLKI